MKDWDLGFEFFVIGFFAGFFLMGIFRFIADVDYSYFNQRLELIEQVCERVESKPDSFDINEVTCNNGKTYKIQ